MGFSLLVMMGWLGLVIAGIVLILRGRDGGNRVLVMLGSLLIAVVTVYGFYAFFIA